MLISDIRKLSAVFLSLNIAVVTCKEKGIRTAGGPHLKIASSSLNFRHTQTDDYPTCYWLHRRTYAFAMTGGVPLKPQTTFRHLLFLTSTIQYCFIF